MLRTLSILGLNGVEVQDLKGKAFRGRCSCEEPLDGSVRKLRHVFEFGLYSDRCDLGRG